ncbi:DUF4913 domain-containing protein [Streptomyces ossamyceticus]|nr:DUF4913 domain-containing protein [Streptomyces ossamyceticus]
MTDSQPGSDPQWNVPVGMFQDIEDLKANVTALTAQVEGLSQMAAAGLDAAVEDGPEPTGHDPDADAEDEGEGEWQFPPFLPLLDSPLYDEELRALTEWVEAVLVPGFLAEPSADARWCHLWFEHNIAVYRLHALWLAWQELTDPTTCGYTGPSVWFRDHYDPCMRELRAPHGPFQGCTKGEHQINHRPPGLVPSAWRHESP